MLFFLTACVGQEAAKPASSKPEWISNPKLNGSIGAVGIAGAHMKGISYQRDLAIQRALKNLSYQQGVDVTTSTNLQDKCNGNNCSSSMNQNSSLNSTSKVTAHIESTWVDNYSKEIYVWMVLD
jgi:hypothetical protein